VQHIGRLSIVVGLAAVLAVTGCGQGAKAPATSDVWAVVDGHEIRKDEVDKAYRRVAPQSPQTASADEELGAKLGLVDELITQHVLLARARALKIEVTDAEVETAYGERKRNLSDAAFLEELKARNLTVEDMKQSLRDELVTDRVMEREVKSKISVSDQEISDFYNKNRAQFNVPETQYRVAQIVITPMRDQQIRNRLKDDAITPEEAARKAQMLMGRLKGGTAFSTLAMDYSEDPQSAPQGGDLGYISESQLAQVPPQLRDVVLKAQPGNVSVLSAGGAHTLVLLVAREPAGQRELSTPAVRDGINTQLRERKEQLLRVAFLTSLRNDAKISNYLARQIVDGAAKPAAPAPAPAASPGK
jgi:peptidyl-prolyl cis-trans isomerase SurA